MSWVCANEVAGVGQPMSLLGLGERRRTSDPDPTRPILPGPVPGRADFVLVEASTLLKAASLQRPSSTHTSSRTGSTQFEMSLEISI